MTERRQVPKQMPGEMGDYSGKHHKCHCQPIEASVHKAILFGVLLSHLLHKCWNTYQTTLRLNPFHEMRYLCWTSCLANKSRRLSFRNMGTANHRLGVMDCLKVT
jgi:hypothetical protein